MAPRKKTEEKASANEAADMVLHYLRKSLTSTCQRRVLSSFSILMSGFVGKQNRPYSAIDVSANLHNKVTKGTSDPGRDCQNQ
jgi:26S proteasome regulatory subunit (ATPase 3-interacting protein)